MLKTFLKIVIYINYLINVLFKRFIINKFIKHLFFQNIVYKNF